MIVAIARSTYRYLQQKQNVSFPIHAEDLLDEDLGLDSEDVEAKCARSAGGNAKAISAGDQAHMPIATVEDLVRFVQACPRISELAA